MAGLAAAALLIQPIFPLVEHQDKEITEAITHLPTHTTMQGLAAAAQQVLAGVLQAQQQPVMAELDLICQ
jgi:hypothetical protein